MAVIPMFDTPASSCDLADVPTRLRVLAAAVEAGEYGDSWVRCTVVLQHHGCEHPAVLAYGPATDAPRVFMDLHSAMNHLSAMRIPVRG